MLASVQSLKQGCDGRIEGVVKMLTVNGDRHGA
jgi:hypothetical protein